MKRLLFGFHPNTLPSRRPLAYTQLQKAFCSAGADMVAWYMGERPPCGASFPFVESAPDAFDGSDLVLDDAVHRKWVERVSYRQRLAPADADHLVRKHAAMALGVLEVLDPDLFVGWNTLHFSWGIVADVAQRLGIPVLSMEHGAIPNSLRLDCPSHAVPIPFRPDVGEAQSELGAQLLSSCAKCDLSLYGQQVLPPDLSAFREAHASGRKCILVLGSMETDTGQAPAWCEEKPAVLPAFSTTYEIASFLAANTDHFVAFKPHPFWQETFPGSERLDPAVQLVHSEPLSLVDEADVVVSALTKLELAAIVHGKHVVSVGLGFFGGLPIGGRADSREALLAAVETLPVPGDRERDQENLRRALGFLYSTRWWIPHLPDISVPPGALTVDAFVDLVLESARSAPCSGRSGSLEPLMTYQHMPLVAAETQIARQQDEIARQQGEITRQHDEIARQQDEIARQQKQLNAILNSRTWRFSSKFRRAADRLLGRRA